MRQPDTIRSANESGLGPERAPALWIGNARWLDFVNTRYVDRGQPQDVLSSFSALIEWLGEDGTLSADDAQAFAARWAGTAEATTVLDESLALRDALRGLAEALATRAATEEDRAARSSTGPAASEHLGPREASAGMQADWDPALTTAAAAINRVFRALVGYSELAPADPAAGAPASGAGPRNVNGGGRAARAARGSAAAVSTVTRPGTSSALPRFVRRTRPTDDNPLRLLASVADSAADLLCGVGDPSLVRRCGNPKCVLYFYDTTKNRHRRFCSPTTCGNRVKAAARYRRAREAAREDSTGSATPHAE